MTELEPWGPDRRALEDLAEFARVEIEANDIEPWAELIAQLHTQGTLDLEQTAWLVALYNSYDDLGSAWNVARRWPTPQAWAAAPDRDQAAGYPCTQERRGLRGGRVLTRHASYLAQLDGQPQLEWLGIPIHAAAGRTADAFGLLTAHLRTVWGVGRQSAFEWAEFTTKTLGLPAIAGDAQLWESEGPRRCLQRLYGNPTPTREWLEQAAHATRDHLSSRGVWLSWEDFETVICDFNVMRDGRYYPGQHLAALLEEIRTCPPEDHPVLLEAWDAVVPRAWRRITPGINPRLRPLYRDTGQLIRNAT